MSNERCRIPCSIEFANSGGCKCYNEEHKYKGTVVNWLRERLDKLIAEEYTIEQLLSDFDKAKEIEKERIMEAFMEGHYETSAWYDGSVDLYKQPEDYYAETFETKNPNQ